MVNSTRELRNFAPGNVNRHDLRNSHSASTVAIRELTTRVNDATLLFVALR